MTPRLSVIVPFYDVENYFTECLESLARQTLRELEVIMVDDGSPDGSAVIAKAYADRDPRFRLVQQENAGLGPARNTGVRHATGEYLAFADSDDILARYAYELLVGSLDETGSDIASGNVKRLNSTRVWASRLHADVFPKTRQQTHITRFGDLLRDRTAWNKVFRRSFWDRHAFEFPPGLYEDAPVTIPAHVLAGSVDVLNEVVYYWREREDGAASITQRRADRGNLEDRVASIRQVAHFLHEQGLHEHGSHEHGSELKAEYDRSILDDDLTHYVAVADQGDAAYRERLFELVNVFLAETDGATVAGLSSIKRLKYHLIRQNRADDLLTVLDFERSGVRNAPVERRGVLRPHWYADYPFRGELPDDLFRVDDELVLRTGLDGMRWRDDGVLEIEGHAYVDRLPMPDAGTGRIEVWLKDAKSERSVKLPVRRVARPDVTADAKQSSSCYDGAGFVAEVDPDRFRQNGRWKRATWSLHVSVTCRGLRRRGALRRAGSVQLPGHDVTADMKVQPTVSGAGNILLNLRPVVPLITVCHAEGDTLVLHGRCAPDTPPDAEVIVSRRQGSAILRLAVERGTEADEFRARLELDRLAVVDAEVAELAAHTEQTGDGIDWDFWLDAPGRKAPLRLSAADAAVGSRYAVGGRQITLVQTRNGNLSAVERSTRPVVTAASWTDGRLLLTGDFDGSGARPDRLTLRRRKDGGAVSVPLAWEGRLFSAAVDPSLGDGRWDLYADDVAVTVDRALRYDLPGEHVAGHQAYGLAFYQTDALRLVVGPALAADETGPYAQAVLRDRDYPRYQTEPLLDLAVFESFRGRQYSDSPRAIYRELRRRNPGIDCVWITGGLFGAPDGARTVLQNSREHYEVLARARYIVGNDPQPEWFRKRDGQTYVQTWHGTPLKRIGFDIENPRFAAARGYLKRFAVDVAQWDLLVSPNPFSTPIMRRAFRYDGEVIEAGYPRNDVLLADGRDELAARVRERLGIEPGKRAVLYAPTWRDDQFQAGRYRFGLRLDLERARRELGDDHVLLVRGHFNVAEAVPGDGNGFVIDVTGYPDIAELYLAADLMITDYSSVMFDFAVTGKPMLFFAYDLEHYRDEVRGFYFDLAAEAPGPLLRTSDEVIAALREFDASEHRAAYRAFTEKFCPLDDGHAAARVVDRVFGG